MPSQQSGSTPHRPERQCCNGFGSGGESVLMTRPVQRTAGDPPPTRCGTARSPAGCYEFFLAFAAAAFSVSAPSLTS